MLNFYRSTGFGIDPFASILYLLNTKKPSQINE